MNKVIESVKKGMLALMLVSPISVFAQTPIDASESSLIVVAPLFEYPVAPEELENLQERTDWLMDNFWLPMDFKNTSSVDQNALNDAFNVYSTAAIHASEKKVLDSVNALIKSLKNNPVLLLQFAKGAEESFYGPRAAAWSDALFLPFVDAVLSDKSIPEARKLRYKSIKETLKRNSLNSKFPKLRLTMRDGHHYDFVPRTEFTLVEIGNPECDDCRFAKLKLEIASDIQEMIDDKKVEILFLVADSVPEDEEKILDLFKEYPQKWLTGISYGADDILDIRLTPCFYILGKKGEILAKNLDVASAVDRIRQLTAGKENK